MRIKERVSGLALTIMAASIVLLSLVAVSPNTFFDM